LVYYSFYYNFSQTSTWRDWGDSYNGKEPTNTKSQLTPLGRKGHTASVYNGYMLIYGGYRDLKGSLGDLWAFHFGKFICFIQSQNKNIK